MRTDRDAVSILDQFQDTCGSITFPSPEKDSTAPHVPSDLNLSHCRYRKHSFPWPPKGVHSDSDPSSAVPMDPDCVHTEGTWFAQGQSLLMGPSCRPGGQLGLQGWSSEGSKGLIWRPWFPWVEALCQEWPLPRQDSLVLHKLHPNLPIVSGAHPNCQNRKCLTSSYH